MSTPYGKELILDLHDCDVLKFNRRDLGAFFQELCDRIDMEPCELFWWDDEGLPQEECQTEPHLKGTSAVQFIMTSNITIHTLDLLGAAYINVFSCKEFDAVKATQFCETWFRGRVVASHNIERL